MRLVGWNANYNNHRRAFEENVALLEPFKADVLVICETAPPQPGDRAFFVGGTPGLAVVARDGIEIEPHPMNDGAPPLFARFRVGAPAAVLCPAALCARATLREPRCRWPDRSHPLRATET